MVYQMLFYPSLTLPDVLGRELDFLVSPQYIGGIKEGTEFPTYRDIL
jgi:hypothetical protein